MPKYGKKSLRHNNRQYGRLLEACASQNTPAVYIGLKWGVFAVAGKQVHSRLWPDQCQRFKGEICAPPCSDGNFANC